MRRIALLLGAVLLLARGLGAAEPGVVAPNENLVTEGLPPITAALADRAQRYTEFRSGLILDWHPTRREMLVSTRFADTNQVHQVKSPGGARTQLTFFADRVGGASYRPHRGDYFIFNKDAGGGEWFQYYRYDLETGDSTLLTDGKSRNTGATWSTGGERIAYGSTRRNRKDVDFYLMNPAQAGSDRLLAENEGGGWAVADWSPDDKQLLALESLSINEGYLWTVDAESGRKTLLTPKGETEKVAYQPIAFSKDGRGIFTLTDRDSEFLRLAYLDLQTKQHEYLTAHIKWDIEEARLSNDGKLLAFVVNENGASSLRLLDTATKKELPAPKLPSGVISNLQWRENGRELGFSLSSARSPADAHSLEIASGDVQRWTFSETGGLNAASFPEPELVTWKSFDSQEISGFLYRPPAKFAGKRPVIVHIHGGPEGQFRPIFLGRNHYYLCEQGVAVLFPNIRGSAGYGKSFLKLDNGFLREDSYKDIAALFDWIKQQPGLDGKRIMVTGGSYGGHMTLAIATRYNDAIRCSLDVVGMSNLVTFLERTEAYRRDLRRIEYGDERDPKMRAFLERIAPLNHVDQISKPLFIVQGQNDPRVPLSEAEQMLATLRKKGTPVWYLMAKDEGHGFAKKKNADFQFYATILFIEKYLLGDGSSQ